MFRMGIGHSDELDPDAALRAVIDQARAGLGDAAPAAGLIFVTPEADHGALLSGFRSGFPGASLVGSTSSGEMSSVLGFREDSLTAAFFASDEVDITTGLGRGLSEDPPGAVRDAVEQAGAATSKEPRLCITTPSLGADQRTLLELLRAELGEHVPVLGGGSAPTLIQGPLEGSRQFWNDTVTEDSMPILLFSGPLNYSIGVDTGWQPVGPTGVVTRASDSILHEIDHQPAVKFYERYLGPGIEPAIANPLAVFEEESGSFYLRAPTQHDPDTGSIVVFGGIQEGAVVQLTIANTEEVFEGTRAAARKAMEGYPSGAEPEAALVFSCAIRKVLLGTRTGRELDLIRELLGQHLPVFGFYCFGEIAPIDERRASRFLNETIVTVLMGTG